MASLTFDVMFPRTVLLTTAVVCIVRAEWKTVEAADLAAVTAESSLVFRGKLLDIGDGSARFEPDRVYKGSGAKLVEIQFPTLAGCVPTTPVSLLSHSHWLVMAKPRGERWVSASRCAGLAPISPVMSAKPGTIEADLFAGLSDPSAAGRIESWKRLAGFRASGDRQPLLRKLEPATGEERRWALAALETSAEQEPEILAELRDFFPRASRAQSLSIDLEHARRVLDMQIEARAGIRDIRAQPRLKLAVPPLDHSGWVDSWRGFVDASLAAERLPAVAAQLRHSQARIRWEALAAMARMEPECKLPPPDQRVPAVLDERAAECAAHWSKLGQ